jgi:hypothetical protein
MERIKEYVRNHKEGTTVAILLAATVFCAAMFFVPLPTTRVEETFSIKVKVLTSGESIDKAWFTYGLYASNDSNDWSKFIHVESGRLSWLVESSLTGHGNCGYFISFNGSGPGNTTYPKRWKQIYPGYENVLLVIARPAFANVSLVNSTTGVPLDLAAGVDSGEVRFRVGTDPATPLSGYIVYYDYQAEDSVMPSIQITFNVSINMTSFSMADEFTGYGLLHYRVNQTCLQFRFPALLSTVKPVLGLFNATGVARITKVDLTWGHEILDSIT